MGFGGIPGMQLSVGEALALIGTFVTLIGWLYKLQSDSRQHAKDIVRLEALIAAERQEHERAIVASQADTRVKLDEQARAHDRAIEHLRKDFDRDFAAQEKQFAKEILTVQQQRLNDVTAQQQLRAADEALGSERFQGLSRQIEVLTGKVDDLIKIGGGRRHAEAST